MEKILFVLNLSSGTGMAAEIEKDIVEQAGEHDCRYRIEKLGKEDWSKAVNDWIDEFDPSVVVAGGGDGTVNMIAREIMHRDLSLGILPLGSSNGMAYQLGIPEDPIEALKIIFQMKKKPIDLLEINEEHICLHMSDIGMNARVIKRYEKEDIRGIAGYAKQYFKELGKTKKFYSFLQADGIKKKIKAVMVIITNASFYGTGANINPEGKIDDGLFEVVLIKPYPFWFMLYALKSLFTRSLTKQPFIENISCREAVINILPPQETQVDGEYTGLQDRLSVRILPAKIEMITRDQSG